MRTLKAAMVAACAVVVGWAFTASADIPASAYVQDGLIAQWDGIDNAGTGTHDPAATTWTELKGGLQTTATALTFAGGDHAVFNGTANSGTCVSGSFPAALVAISNGHFTAEARFTPRKYVQYGGLFHFGVYNSTRYFSVSEDDGDFVGAFQYKRNAWDADNCKSGVRTTIGQVTNVTAIASDGNNIIYLGTEMISNHKAGTYVKYESTNFQFGRYAAQGYRAMMYLYSVRLYDKVLSEEEIAWNKLIDDCRFSATPSLYRLTGDGKGVEVAIVLAYDTAQGSVTVDDVATEPSERWHELGRGMRTVTATPAAGYRFSRWNGTVDPSEVANPTIRVPANRGVSISAVFDRVGELTARSYVQTGLVAQWDAIENAGIGTHDANATEWKALVGDIDFPLTGCEVSSDAISIPGGVSPTVERSIFGSPAYSQPTTIELYWATPGLPEASTYSDYFLFASDESYFYRQNNTQAIFPVLVKGSPNKHWSKFAYTTAEQRTFATASFVNGATALSDCGLYYNGSRRERVGDATTSTLSAIRNRTSLCLSTGSRSYAVKYRSIRVYNRPLTAAEAAHNAVVDRIRFLGAEQAEAGGWRVNAETQELEVRVSVRADGDGTVKIDDGTAGADASVWRTLSAEDTVTLTAEPAAGSRFVSWTGDNSLTAAQKISATLTLPALAARNLTAVFITDGAPYWTYAVGAGTLTLGDTAFTVTASTSRGDGIAISTLTSLAEDGVVNLMLPIVGDDGCLYALTSIGTVFTGSEVLTELYIPDTVTSLAGSALKGASKLGYVYLPAYLETLGSSVFQDCTSLTNLTNFLAPTVRSIGGHCFNGSKISQTLYLSNPDWTATTTYSFIYSKYLKACDMTGSGIKSFNGGWEFFGDGALREVILSDKFETFPNVNPIFGSCGSLRTFKFRGGPPTIIVTDPINGMKDGFTWFAPKWDKRWEEYLAAQEDCTVTTPTSADCSNFLAVHPNEPIPTMKVSISKISNHLFSWWYPNPPPECEEVSLVDLLGYDGVKPEFSEGDANLLDGTTWTANTAHWTNGWYTTAGHEAVVTLPATAKAARAMKAKRYRLHQLCMGDKTYFKYANSRAPTAWQLYGKRTEEGEWVLLDERVLDAESDVAWAYLKDPTAYPVTGVAQTVPPREQCSIAFDIPEENWNCYCAYKFVPTNSYDVEHQVTADTTPIALMELEILGELPSSAPHVTACAVARQGWTDLDFSVTIDSKGEQPALDRYAAKAYATAEVAADADFETVVASSAQAEIGLGASVLTVPGLTGRTGYFARVIVENDLGFAATNVIETATLQSPFELGEPEVDATEDGELTASIEILNLYAASATAELWYADEPGGEYRKLAERQVGAAGIVVLASEGDGFPAGRVGQVRITVTADGVSESRDKTPYGLWIVDRKALTMTHSRSGAAFNVTVADDNVSLTSALDLKEETVFDLTAAVFDTKGGAMTLVSVGTAFKTNLTLKEVLLPDSVKTLSANAFDSCTKLAKVRLPNALESLGSNAFNGCGQLEDISPCLPPTCTTIGGSAFSSCKVLPHIDIPEGVRSIPGSFLNGCGKIREVRIPDSCTSIGGSAFNGCSLTNVLPRVLPPQITFVDANAFRGFSGKIPELILDNPALTKIGNATFYGQSFGLVDLSKSSFAGFSIGWEFGGGYADEMILPPCCTNLCNPGNGALGTVKKLRFTGNPPVVGTGTNVLGATITTYYAPIDNEAWDRYLADHPEWVQPVTSSDLTKWKSAMRKDFPGEPLRPRPSVMVNLNGIGGFRPLVRYGKKGLMLIVR